MNPVLFFDRIVSKTKRLYRNYVFRKKIGCSHKQISLVGEVTLINTRIEMGKNVVLYPGVMFYGDGPIRIGNNVSIGNHTIIYSSKKGGIHIGDDTMIAAQCYITDTDHGMQEGKMMREQEVESAPVVIGADAWLGTNVAVLKGSKIGSGAVIGAKALVRGEIPDNAVAVGIPAKVVKYRG